MKKIVYQNASKEWALSSAGRASALQAGGHRFEPYSAHHFFGLVVQLVRTLACHARGRRFEPDSGRHFFILPRQLSWQSKGLKIPVSLVRFPFEAPEKKSTKLTSFNMLKKGIEKEVAKPGAGQGPAKAKAKIARWTILPTRLDVFPFEAPRRNRPKWAIVFLKNNQAHWDVAPFSKKVLLR